MQRRSRTSEAGPLRALLGLVCALMLALGLLGLGTTAADAVAAPTGLSPASGTVNANPVLSWTPVAGASSYDVQIATTSDFSSPLVDQNTVNRRYTPTAELPMAQLYWRVRAHVAAQVSAWRTAGFTRNRLAGPSPTSPADGAELAQPSGPPLLTWAPVDGASSYTVEIDTSAAGDQPDWVDTTSYSTSTTSLVVPAAQAAGTYWWRVTAQVGSSVTLPSAQPRSYVIDDLAAMTGIIPADGSSVEQVVLGWNALPGAVSYDIRVSSDAAFNTVIDTQTAIQGTRYSPARTYDVDDYYWQVRPRNTFGTAKDWAEVPVHTFSRTYYDADGQGTDTVPTLVYPPSQVSPAVLDPFYYQWSPARLASRYRLDVGTDPNFSPGSFTSCVTTQTTYIPGGGGGCLPGVGTTYYWRVKALDGPGAEIQGRYSAIGRFVFSKVRPVLLSPVDGATVDIPTLRWAPVLNTSTYHVVITSGNGSVVAAADTSATSYTPTTVLDPTTGPFTWAVYGVDDYGRSTPVPVVGNGARTFSLSGATPVTGAAALTPLTPTASDSPTTRFPELTWEPASGAAFYQVSVGTHGSSYFRTLGLNFGYAAGTDTSPAYLPAGSYDWFVSAYNTNGMLIGYGPVGTFSIADLPSVTGQQIALDGSGLAAGTTCTLSLGTGTGAGTGTGNVCSGQLSTPVLSWAPVTGAGSYLIYVSKDRNFQNMVYGSYSDSTSLPRTSETSWTPTTPLPDSQAGAAYYWFIRPCKGLYVGCAPDPLQADNAFDKRSPAVQGLTTDATPANDVTMSWQDYLATNLAATNPVTGEAPHQAAMSYHLQVATNDAFTNVIDDATVDQTTYTAPHTLYPEGTFSWRVQAIDGGGNASAWSAIGHFTKASPVPVLSSPSGASSGTPAFRWAATPFASSYALQVYKNGDKAASPANLVINVGGLQQTAFTSTSPLPTGTTYVWRVRRVDYSGNPGAWSAWNSFSVTGTAPVQVAPASGALVSSTTGAFSWRAVPGTTRYRFERRQAGASGDAELVDTAMTAWAEVSPISTGSWQWRVSTLDAVGQVVASSPWRAFHTDATAPTVVTIAPVNPVGRTANVKLKLSESVKGATSKDVRLYLNSRGKPLPAKVTTKGSVITINPSGKLKKTSNYELRVTAGVTDLAGNPLAAASYGVSTK